MRKSNASWWPKFEFVNFVTLGLSKKVEEFHKLNIIIKEY